MAEKATEMEVRVAEVIDAAETAWLRQKGDAIEGLAEEPEFPIYVTLARAAIRAMRTPTEEMFAAEGIHKSCHMCGGAGELWPLMIDAASPSSASET